MELHAGGVVNGFAHLYGHQHILKGSILPGKVMCVVCRHKRNAGFLRHTDQLTVHLGLLRDAMILYFQKVVVFPKNTAIPQGSLFRLFIPAIGYEPRQLTSQTGRQADEALMKLFQQFMVDTRLHIKTFRKAKADHVNQIAVSGHILAQQNQVAVPFAAGVGAAAAGTRGNIDLAADDGVNIPFFRGAVKVDCAVHYAVVSDCDCRLSELCDAVHQLLDAARAVEQAIFGVYVEMGKGFHQEPPPSCSAILRIRFSL